MQAKLKHDFTNNCLRIEILQKLALEDLDKGESPSAENLYDYLKFLKQQISYLEEMGIS